MGRRCPQCGAEVEWEGNAHRPFCSERCRLIDLGSWLGERYAIPGEPAEIESSDAAEDDGARARPAGLGPGASRTKTRRERA